MKFLPAKGLASLGHLPVTLVGQVLLRKLRLSQSFLRCEFFAKLSFGDFEGGEKGGDFGFTEPFYFPQLGRACAKKTAEAAELGEEFARKSDGVFAANAATKQYSNELGVGKAFCAGLE